MMECNARWTFEGALTVSVLFYYRNFGQLHNNVARMNHAKTSVIQSGSNVSKMYIKISCKGKLSLCTPWRHVKGVEVWLHF
jgi:hypothetical protein